MTLWSDCVKKCAKKWGVSYREAQRDPRCKKLYEKKTKNNRLNLPPPPTPHKCIDFQEEIDRLRSLASALNIKIADHGVRDSVLWDYESKMKEGKITKEEYKKLVETHKSKAMKRVEKPLEKLKVIEEKIEMLKKVQEKCYD